MASMISPEIKFSMEITYSRSVWARLSAFFSIRLSEHQHLIVSEQALPDCAHQVMQRADVAAAGRSAPS
jgi:hypothetical protein